MHARKKKVERAKIPRKKEGKLHGRKMAEIQQVDDGAKERKRKPNFSVSEISAITESVQENLDILQSKLTNAITNEKKNQLWEEITKAVNGVGHANRSVQDVKDKWKNLHSVAKKEFTTFKRETKKTGGGPAPKQPFQASEKIIEILEDTNLQPAVSKQWPRLPGYTCNIILSHVSGHVMLFFIPHIAVCNAKRLNTRSKWISCKR